VDSIAPASDCKHIDHILEIDGVFFEACCQSSHVFHFAKEALNNVSHRIKVGVMLNRMAGI
jgi:hypothetical protein